MKKLNSYAVLLLVVASCFLFQFCDKNAADVQNECKSCENKNFTIEKTTILGRSMEIAKYGTNENSVFMMDVPDNFKTLKYIFDDFRNYNLPELQFDKIANFTLFTTKNIVYTKIIQVDNENILGLIVYLKTEKENEFNVRVFKKINNKFVENELSNLKTQIISSNYCFGVSKLLFREAKVNFVDFTNKLIDVKNYKNSFSDFDDKLKIMLVVNGLTENDGCALPCPIIYNQDLICARIVVNGIEQKPECRDRLRCKMASIIDKLKNNKEENKLPSGDIDKLYNFRDQYLLKNEGGKKYVDLYYKLSSNLEMSDFSISLCIETVDLITKIVVPATESIVANPNSKNNILVNNIQSQILISYLQKVKNVYKDQQSKQNIEMIIEKVKLATNKSSYYLTNDLINQ